jgi:hypothetical protein
MASEQNGIENAGGHMFQSVHIKVRESDTRFSTQFFFHE